LNSKGEVIGIVTATLNQESALKTTGTMAQNVNYALKIAYVLPILISNDVNYKNLSASVQSDVKIVEKSDPSVVMIIAE
jgi:S1-C subfamily serine protease